MKRFLGSIGALALLLMNVDVAQCGHPGAYCMDDDCGTGCAWFDKLCWRLSFAEPRNHCGPNGHCGHGGHFGHGGHHGGGGQFGGYGGGGGGPGAGGPLGYYQGGPPTP